MAERAYPEDPAYRNKTQYYYAFIERYEFGKKYTNGKTVLDIPCGTGWGTSFIDNAQEICGVDISSEAIQYARTHFNGIFSEGSMQQIPFTDNIFDVALCFEGMEHISREAGIDFLNEIKRVVKNGGLIIGSVPVLDEGGYDTGNPYHIFEYPEDYLKIVLRENFEVIDYCKKTGGDGPIVYFVVKNQMKHKKILPASAFGNETDFQNEIDRQLSRNPEGGSVVIIDTDPDEKMVKLLQRTPDPRVKIINFTITPRISRNQISKMEQTMEALKRKITGCLNGIFKKIPEKP